VAKARFYDDKGEPTDDWLLKKLFKEIAPRFADRPGGYTRIIKRHQRRLGDAGRTAFIELLKEGETKAKKTQAPAPAPRVTEPAPAPETPPAAPTSEAPATPPPAAETPSSPPETPPSA